MKRSNRREGFTLVELLIVIVVVGVLAAMMMLSSTEAVSSARATKLISDMTQIKKAVNAWYLENYDRLGSGAGGVKEERGIMVNGTLTRFSEFINGVGAKEIMKYISEGTSINYKHWQQVSTQHGGSLHHTSHREDKILVCFLLSRQQVCETQGENSF